MSAHSALSKQTIENPEWYWVESCCLMAENQSHSITKIY
jgi:hypothetical protein